MRYIIGLLLGIGVIILTFVLIFRALSGGGGDEQQQRSAALLDYANTNAVVRYTIDGPVNQNEIHSKVRITVSKDQVLFEQIQGYEGKLVQTKTYPSNPQAYATLLRSLDKSNFTLANKNADKDERGYCPKGKRYIYEIINGSDTVQRLWSTSCNAREGSYQGGDATTIRTLFQRQVPDYGSLTSRIQNL